MLCLNRTAVALPFLLVVGGCGHGSFESSFESVRPGMTRAAVRAQLGGPDARRLSETTDLACEEAGGSPDACRAYDVLGGGAPYEVWEWSFRERGERYFYYVVFGSADGAGEERWEVIGRETHDTTRTY